MVHHMTENPQVLLSTKEVAAMLHEDPRSIQRKAKAGVIPHAAKMPGAKGAYIFDMSTIQRIERERRASSQGKAA